MLGIRNRGCRMVGTDDTTEQWRPPDSTKEFRGGCVRVRERSGQN